MNDPTHSVNVSVCCGVGSSLKSLCALSNHCSHNPEYHHYIGPSSKGNHCFNHCLNQARDDPQQLRSIPNPPKGNGSFNLLQ